MEIYKDRSIRQRINVSAHNPLITSVDIDIYNAVCELVDKYWITELRLEETCVEKVHDCMLHTSDVLVHGEPEISLFLIYGSQGMARRGVPGIVP